MSMSMSMPTMWSLISLLDSAPTRQIRKMLMLISTERSCQLMWRAICPMIRRLSQG
jgi:uncharacterized protein with von Willebrand factor type A (vWA) domain